MAPITQKTQSQGVREEANNRKIYQTISTEKHQNVSGILVN